MVDPSIEQPRSVLSAKEQEAVFEELYTRRSAVWQADWCFCWRSLGEKDVLSDSALYDVSKVADTIESIDDLRSVTTIAYWSRIAPWLATTTQAAVRKVLEANLKSLPSRAETSDAAAALAAIKNKGQNAKKKKSVGQATVTTGSSS